MPCISRGNQNTKPRLKDADHSLYHHCCCGKWHKSKGWRGQWAHTLPRAELAAQSCTYLSLSFGHFLMAIWNFLSVLYREAHSVCWCWVRLGKTGDQLKYSQIVAFDTCFSGEILTSFVDKTSVWNSAQWALTFTFCNELNNEIKPPPYHLFVLPAVLVTQLAVPAQVIITTLMLFKDPRIFSQSHRIAGAGRDL